MQKRVHIVFHAHIDPVQLWPWRAGLDKCLATFRSENQRTPLYTVELTRGLSALGSRD